MRALPGRETRTVLRDPAVRLDRQTVVDRQRARIRRATGELVAKRGFAAVSVELIIKRARVGYRTFYNHYPNKEAAFLDLFETAVAGTGRLIGDRMSEAGGEWPEQVAVAIRSFFEAILAEPLIARACLVEGPTASPEMLARYEQVAKSFLPVLREGRNYNPDAKALPQTLEDTLAGAVLWSAYQRLNFSEVDRITELIPENVELVLRPYIGEAEAAQVARETAAATKPGS